jgi:hypothetical protein
MLALPLSAQDITLQIRFGEQTGQATGECPPSPTCTVWTISVPDDASDNGAEDPDNIQIRTALANRIGWSAGQIRCEQYLVDGGYCLAGELGDLVAMSENNAVKISFRTLMTSLVEGYRFDLWREALVPPDTGGVDN